MTDAVEQSQPTPLHKVSSRHPQLVGYALVFFTMLVWGSFTIMSRFSVVHVFTAWDISAIRFATSFVVLLPIVLFQKKIPTVFNARMLKIAAFGGLGYCCFIFIGFQFAPVAHAVIWVNGSLPFWMAITGVMILGEAVSKDSYISLSILGVGLLLMIGIMINRHHFVLGIGDLFFFSASACWAIYTAFLKQSNFTGWEVTCGVAMITAVIYLPIYVLLLPKKIMAASFLEIGIQAVFQGIVVSILAMLTYLGALKRLGSIKVGTILALAPLLAAVAAVPILHEPLQLEIIVGLVAVGIAALQPWRIISKNNS